MRSFLLCMMGALFTIAMAGQRVVASQPTLVRAEFSTDTDYDGKDQDTGLYVDVWTADHSLRIARCENADKFDYDAYTHHTIDLDVLASEIEKDACYGFHCKLTQRMHGHDKWVCRGRVTLYFSDGTELIARFGTTALRNDGASVSFTQHGEANDDQ
jgi:hypothetical protein